MSQAWNVLWCEQVEERYREGEKKDLEAEDGRGGEDEEANC